MSDRKIGVAGRIAIGLAIVAGLLSLSRAFLAYSRTGAVDVGKVALSLGVPVLIIVIVKSASRRP